MQHQNPLRCIFVYCLMLLVLCYFHTSEAATQHHGRAHSHRTLRTKHHLTKGRKDSDNDEQKDDNQGEDNDDDDDDDDEDEEAPASKAEKEKEKLQADVAETEKKLRANLAEQRMLKEKVKHLSDESASDMEIDSQATLVSNETESPAMGTMLGDMWKDMRMFQLPSFAQHVEEEVNLLKREEKRLESELKDQKLAEDDEAKKLDEEEKKKDEEDAGEKKESAALDKEDKEDKDEESKEDDDDDDEETDVAKGARHQGMASGVNSLESGGERLVENLKSFQGHRVLTQYSYWHMSGAQKTRTLINSLVYFAFGTLIAVLYDQVRKKRPEYLNPHPIQERARGSYQLQQNDFTNSIFGCFADAHVCISGCFCTACRWSHTLDQKNLMKYWKAFFLMFILVVISPYTVGLSEVAIVIAGVYFRQLLRQKYGIERSTHTVVSDCLAWMCCMPCAVIQEAREEAVKRDFSNDQP